MRQITDHIVNPTNDKLTVSVTDEPGAGGANHRYVVDGFDPYRNPSFVMSGDQPPAVILFQNGAIPEAGVNGITHEVLLAIIADRLVSFQNGPFANDYNAKALEHINAAQEALLDRTRERMERGVEGTHAK